jgi:hypothetical protein
MNGSNFIIYYETALENNVVRLSQEAYIFIVLFS